MNAKQALNHDWFTNPAHKEDFENVYRRAVRGWKPRAIEGPILYLLDPHDASSGRQSPRRGRSPLPISSLYKPFVHGENCCLRRKIASDQRCTSIQRTNSPLLIETSNVHNRDPSPTLSDPDYQKKELDFISAEESDTDSKDDWAPDNSHFQQVDRADISPKYHSNQMVSNWESGEKNPAPKGPILASQMDISGDTGPKQYGPHSTRIKPRIRLPFSPAAWNRGVDRLVSRHPIPPSPGARALIRPVNTLIPTGFGPILQLSVSAGDIAFNRPSDGLNGIKPVSDSSTPALPARGKSKAKEIRKRSFHNAFDLDGRVFEEIEDSISCGGAPTGVWGRNCCRYQ